ncbi:MAG: 50S ribosomal protein L11 methyltransferase [Bacteroidia bacterium]|nr:50S ribosomal protein L11 methyltransferase [Bacteroidia bacterium]MDW8158439.1 50S ribosomal protein L11 methyltransferase [Bacteroidia bacterium]
MLLGFIEAKFLIPEQEQEVAIAELSEWGFDGFLQDSNYLLAYTTYVDPLLIPPSLKTRLVEQKYIEPQNWNALWEQNFEAVAIDQFCYIYPPFQKPLPQLQYYICIQPQMAFGTGHHPTTQLVIRLMQHLELQAKNVADVGCGTGILGILAAKMGATHVVFLDTDPIAIQNTQENLMLNQIANATVLLIPIIPIIEWPYSPYHLLVANIERNVLLQNASEYTRHLAPGGYLILSGFLVQDTPTLLHTYQSLGLKTIQSLRKDNWSAILLQRNH